MYDLHMATTKRHDSTVINIIVAPEFKSAVRRTAGYHGMSTSEFIREAVRRAMDTDDFRVPAITT